MEILSMMALHLLRQNLLHLHLVNLIKVVITPGLVHILKHRVLRIKIPMETRVRQPGPLLGLF
jgi:hypothetical protein